MSPDLVSGGAKAGPTRLAPVAEGPRRWLFAAWLLGFYTAWTGIVASAGLWPVVRAHWPIAVAMAGGSFVGGSTPVAGGSVGFPVLVYVFNHPARLGRNFSLAIQSVGMVSASIYILTRRRPVEWRLLRPALAGAAIAMPLGMACVAPAIADAGVKVLFSVLYASFGLFHLVRLREVVAHRGPSRTRFATDSTIGFAAGVLGGLLASVIGVGADILMYGVLVLFYRSDIKVAIPTAVLLMAFTSLVGAGCSLLAPAGGASNLVFPYWLAAAPVVVVGGPLGSLVSRHIPRGAILGFVALLCLAQFAWTCYHEHILGTSLALAATGVLAANLVLHALFVLGKRALSLTDVRSQGVTGGPS